MRRRYALLPDAGCLFNTGHCLPRVKRGARTGRREQDIDDGAQAQSKHDAAGYAPFGRRCGRLGENCCRGNASVADQFASDRFRKDRMTGQADSYRDLPGMRDRDRPELPGGPPAIVMANLDARQAAKAKSIPQALASSSSAAHSPAKDSLELSLSMQ